jgi:flagellar protein FlaG
MAGNVDLVTAAAAQVPAPSRSVPPNAVPEQTGNGVAASGQSLPHRAPPAPDSDIDAAVRRLNELMAERQRNLRFHVDEASGRTVITVRDAATHRLVRQIPSAEALAVARALEHEGALVDELI